MHAMSQSFWFVLPGINPVPWTSPDVAIAKRKDGRPYPVVHSAAALKTYKQAVTETLTERYPDFEMIEDEVALRLFFWRRLDEMKGNRRRKGHVADATNLQKSTEDALQGFLFKNDVQVVHAESWVMAQHDAVDPLIVIELVWHPERPVLPSEVTKEVVLAETVTPSDANEHDVPVEDYI
jgi:Holliday junction resolvase RusA-like endonuclease